MTTSAPEPCPFRAFLEGACMDPEVHDLVLELSTHQAAGTTAPQATRDRLEALRRRRRHPSPEWS